MALFVTKEGKRKSPMAVTCFFVDLLFCLVFGGMYALLTGVLHDHLPLGGGMAENWIHCGLIAVVGTAVCCILFLLPDKRIVPYSFASLPVITIMCVVAAFQLEPAARNMMLYVTFLYTLMPILVGNAVSWTVYFKLCKNPMPRVRGSSMEKLTKECVLQSAARLEQESQDAVMRDIPQFFEAEIVTRFAGAVPQKKELNPLVFNMERGICLAETVDFLRECPALRPYDLILANELDSGCARSGERDTAAEIARALGMQYVFGLEFVELKDAAHGFHGNAIFSRWPILWAEVLRLPEQYNWYHDRQKRIGGRNAVFAKLDVQGQEVGAVSIHLENRTSGAGRLQQMKAVLQEVERVFPGIPVVLGGDLNTNTFDGRDKAVIRHLRDEPEELAAAIEMIDLYEPLLQDCTAAGYAWRAASGGADCTRRKPLPEGGCLHMKLDWLLPRGFTVHCSSVISTLTADCGFAAQDSALARYTQPELSDHNVVRASLALPQKEE